MQKISLAARLDTKIKHVVMLREPVSQYLRVPINLDQMVSDQ